MLAVSASQTGNRLLASLSRHDLALLQPHLTPVALNLHKGLERPNRRIEHAYFPHFGIASVVAVQSGDMRVEVGLIGREGMTGSAIVLGSDRVPHETYVQVAGEGQRISRVRLGEAVKASEPLRCYCSGMCKYSWFKPRKPPLPMHAADWMPGLPAGF
jgi:hypothetical protein